MKRKKIKNLHMTHSKNLQRAFKDHDIPKVVPSCQSSCQALQEFEMGCPHSIAVMEIYLPFCFICAKNLKKI